MILTPIYDVYIPHLYGKVIENISSKNMFFKYLVILSVIMMLILFGYNALDWHNSILFPKFQSFLRQQLVDNIIQINQENFKELQIGNVLSKIASASPIFLYWFSCIKDYIIPYTIVALSAMVYFAYHDIWLGISLAIVIGVLGYTMYTSPSTCKDLAVTSAAREHDIYENIEDVFRNIVSVHESNQKLYEMKRLEFFEQRFQYSFNKSIKCVVKHKTVVVPFLSLFLGVFAYRCFYMVQDKKMKTSTFVSLFMILMGMIGNLAWVIDIIRDISIHSGMLHEIETYFKSLKQQHHTTTTTTTVDVQQEGIGFINTTFGYDQASTPVIQNLSLHIPKHKLTLITGEIGSGKSTLVKLLIRLVKPQSGDMYIDGKLYSKLRTKAIRTMIRYIPQNPHLFNRSIIDNISYGNTLHTKEEIINVINKLSINEMFDNHEKGLETLAGKGGSNLSGGQRQIVWCLRVLLSEPQYVIMDEPTASLDASTKGLVKKLVQYFRQKTTFIIITHDDALIDLADMHISMTDGKITMT